MEDWQIYKKQDLSTFCQIINLLYLMKSRIILLGGKAYDKYFDNIIESDIGSVIAAYGCNDLCGIALMKKLH